MKVVLITGASAGFGRACADHLAARGYRVYGTSRRARFEDAEAAAAGPTLLPMDVRDDESVRKAIDFVVGREGRLDVVVNNAGVGLAGAIEDTSVAEAQALFDTNFFGVHRVCRAALPILRRPGRRADREHQLHRRAHHDPVPGLLLSVEVRPRVAQ